MFYLYILLFYRGSYFFIFFIFRIPSSFFPFIYLISFWFVFSTSFLLFHFPDIYFLFFIYFLFIFLIPVRFLNFLSFMLLINFSSRFHFHNLIWMFHPFSLTLILSFSFQNFSPFYRTIYYFTFFMYKYSIQGFQDIKTPGVNLNWHLLFFHLTKL